MTDEQVAMRIIDMLEAIGDDHRALRCLGAVSAAVLSTCPYVGESWIEEVRRTMDALATRRRQ